MKVYAVAAVAAVLLLALTACGESAGNAADGRTAPETTETAAAAEAPAPSVAATPEVETPAEDRFVAEARDRLAGLGSATTIPDATDEQLIAAGHEACAALLAQEPFADVSVVDGEERVQGSFLDSAAIASAGILYFCPEINGKTL